MGCNGTLPHTLSLLFIRLDNPRSPSLSCLTCSSPLNNWVCWPGLQYVCAYLVWFVAPQDTSRPLSQVLIIGEQSLDLQTQTHVGLAFFTVKGILLSLFQLAVLQDPQFCSVFPPKWLSSWLVPSLCCPSGLLPSQGQVFSRLHLVLS